MKHRAQIMIPSFVGMQLKWKAKTLQSRKLETIETTKILQRLK
jgi:hypothetical protein